MQGRSPCPRSAARGTLLCSYTRWGGPTGDPSPGVPPFSFGFCVCADTLGGGRYLALPFDPISLVLAQRNGVEPPKKSAFLPWRLHHSRERYKSVVYTFLARLGAGAGACRGVVRVRRFLGRCVVAPTARSTPFLCSCAKKRGGAPKKRAYGCRHGGCWVPPASPTDSKPQHHSRLRQADLSARSTHRVQANLTHQFVPLGLTPKWERRAGPPSSCGGFKSAFLWRLDTVSLGKHQRNGVERQDKPSPPAQRIGAPAQSYRHPPTPCKSRARNVPSTDL